MKTRVQHYFKDLILIFRGISKSVYPHNLGFNLKCKKFYFPKVFVRNGKTDFSMWNRFRLFSPDDVFDYALVESPKNREIFLNLTTLSNYSYIFFSVRKEGKVNFSLVLLDCQNHVIYERKDKYSPSEEVLVSRSDIDDTIFELSCGKVRAGMEQTALAYLGTSTLILNLISAFLHPEFYAWHCEDCQKNATLVSNVVKGFGGETELVMRRLLEAYKLVF